MTSEFALATAVTAAGESPDGARFSARVHDGWDIAGNANGGYLMAIAARAMQAALGRPTLTLTAHFLAPGSPGPCEVVVAPVRSGRRLATATASLRQGERELLRLLGTFGSPDDGGLVYADGAPPELVPYDEAVVSKPPFEEGLGPHFSSRVRTRIHPIDAGFRSGAPTGRAEIRGWFGFADDGPIDELGLVFACDAFAPPVFNTGLPAGWVPTVELTVHVRAVPVPGLLRCVFRSRFVHGGLLEEDAELWDADGVLCAQSRQLALLPRPA
jgi:acyl-coenzyme A thioesterase PaaI-like protein